MQPNIATAEPPEYLTVEEAAKHFRVSTPTIYRRCADGTLPHVRIGAAGPIRISVSELTRVLGSSPMLGNDPSERRGTQTMRGQSNPLAHTGPEQ